jgi:MFS family permease
MATVGLALGLAALRLPSPHYHGKCSAGSGGRWQRFVLLLVAAAFMGMVYRGVTTFLPKFFALRYVDEASSGTALGGALTTAALMVGLVGMYVAGRLADRGVGPAWVFLGAAAFQIPFLVGIGYSGSAGLVPLAMGVAFFHFMTQPVGNQMVAEFTPPALRGLGYGIYFFMTFGAGSLGATVAGWVSERVELGYVFPALSLLLLPCMAMMVALGLAGNRDARQDRQA